MDIPGFKTQEPKETDKSNINLMKHLVEDCKKPVIAEKVEFKTEFRVLAAVIGGAITRPMEITKRFVSAIR